MSFLDVCYLVHTYSAGYTVGASIAGQRDEIVYSRPVS